MNQIISNSKFRRFLAMLVVLMLMMPVMPVKATEIELVGELELINEAPTIEEIQNPPVDEGLDGNENGENNENNENNENVENNEVIQEQEPVLEIPEEPVLEELEEIEEEEIFENLDGLNEPEEIGSPKLFYPKGTLGPVVNTTPMMRRMMMLTTDGEDSDFGNIPQGPGSIALDKTATPVTGIDNKWEIKLTLTGEDEEKTSDIVLLIDRSGSMASNGRMTAAKAAAVDFVNGLLNDVNDTDTRIALVSFSSNVTVHNSSNPFLTVADKQILIDEINGLSANGGTHIQAGIRQASILLSSSTADEQNMVLLGDGAATYSYEIDNSNTYLEYWQTSSSGRKYFRTTVDVLESDFNYSDTVGSGSDEHTSYESGGSGNNKYRNYYRHGASAVAEAGFFKDGGGTVYTINLSASGDGPWTLENIAGPGNDFTASPGDLNNIFLEVAGNLSYAATNAVITDPMGGMFSIPGINSSNYATLIQVSRGTVSWDDVTETITWNLGNISEASPAYMWYVVEIDPSASNGVDYPTNEHTYVEYTNINDEEAEKSFPIPEVNIVWPNEPRPMLSIDKSADKESYSQVGEVITYTYVVANVGEVVIEGPFVVEDDVLGLVDTSSAPSVLGVKESFTVTATHIVTQQDLDKGFITNKAQAWVVEIVTSPEDSVTVKANQKPVLTVDKTADKVKFTKAGEVITYTYVVKNTGNVTLSEPYSIDDDKIEGIVVPEGVDDLSPGESFTVTATYIVTEEDVTAGFVTNVVGVKGYFGENEVTGKDELMVPFEKEKPEDPVDPEEPEDLEDDEDDDDDVVPIPEPNVPLGDGTLEQVTPVPEEEVMAAAETINEEPVPKATVLPDTGDILNTKLLAFLGAMLMAAGVLLKKKRKLTE